MRPWSVELFALEKSLWCYESKTEHASRDRNIFESDPKDCEIHRTLKRREGDPAQRNELASFEEAMLPHLDAAHNLARWLLRNEQDAEDVVQEAYLRAFKSFDGFLWVQRSGLAADDCPKYVLHSAEKKPCGRSYHDFR